MEAIYGADHPSLWACLSNLGAIYRREGRYGEAEELYGKALALCERYFGPHDARTGRALYRLAAVYTLQGREPAAEALQRRADAIPDWEVADQRVHFATTREKVSGPFGTKFGVTDSNGPCVLTFGTAVIRIPRSEVMNRAERGADAFGQLDLAEGRQTSELSLRCLHIDAASALSDLAPLIVDQIARAARYRAQCVLYVHGYNNSFDEAVARAAMIAFDLDFDGPAFVFAWPSGPGLLSYRADRKRARDAATSLAEALKAVAAAVPNITLHIIAHSTGAEIALSALAELGMLDAANRPKFGQLIFAHADVNPSRLLQSLPLLRGMASGITSYSSSDDWAMWVSHKIRRKASRVGSAVSGLDGVDEIDVTGLGSGAWSLNHDVFLRNPVIFGDIARLIDTGERPPHQRSPHLVPVHSGKGTYWKYQRMRPPGAGNAS